ncbi:MAG: triose-phosphate isomerase [Patescibacteria group bacterium]|jgi:triosephosphate isomerase
MANKIVIANWKMKLGYKESVALAKEMKIKFKDFKGGEVGICPNFISLAEVKKNLEGSPLMCGSQNVFWEAQGAYTGEISPLNLSEIGCDMAIIGHSERREYLLENYEMVHKKLKAVLEVENLMPVVCLGEEKDERKSKKRDFILVDQVNQAFGGLSIMENQKIVVAYEPIWAIGSGVAIEPSDCDYAHKIIRLTLNELFGSKISEKCFRIIYGGSISSKNVNEFVNLENLDGLLVGGASLNAEEFYKVANILINS